MLEQLQKLMSDPVAIGVVVLIVGSLFVGKGALAPQLWSLVKNMLPSIGTPRIPSTGDSHAHMNCLDCLKCIIDHAVDEGDQDLITKLVALLDPIKELHNKVEQSEQSE